MQELMHAVLSTLSAQQAAWLAELQAQQLPRVDVQLSKLPADWYVLLFLLGNFSYAQWDLVVKAANAMCRERNCGGFWWPLRTQLHRYYTGVLLQLMPADAVQPLTTDVDRAHRAAHRGRHCESSVRDRQQGEECSRAACQAASTRWQARAARAIHHPHW